MEVVHLDGKEGHPWPFGQICHDPLRSRVEVAANVEEHEVAAIETCLDTLPKCNWITLAFVDGIELRHDVID